MANANAIATFKPQHASAVLPDTPGWTMSYEQAQMLVGSGFLPTAIKTPEQAIAIVLTGQELGIPTMLSLRSIHIINGRPTLSADLMASLVQRAIDQQRDGEFRVLPPTAESCTVQYRRWGWKEGHSYTYTIEDAKRANLLGKDTWKGHPAAMLRARATAAVCRMAFPDVIAGLYVPEEIDPDGEGVIWEARAVSEPTPISASVREVPQGAPVETEALDAVGALGINSRDGRLVDAEGTDANASPVEAATPSPLEQKRLDLWAMAKELGYSWDAFNVLRRQCNIEPPLDRMTASQVRMLREELEKIAAEDAAVRGEEAEDEIPLGEDVEIEDYTIK